MESNECHSNPLHSTPIESMECNGMQWNAMQWNQDPEIYSANDPLKFERLISLNWMIDQSF
jgi:hypothetical protein